MTNFRDQKDSFNHLFLFLDLTAWISLCKSFLLDSEYQMFGIQAPVYNYWSFCYWDFMSFTKIIKYY